MLFWDAVWGAVGGASDGAGARGRVLFGTLFGGVLLEVLVCNHCYLGSMLVLFGCCFGIARKEGTLRKRQAQNGFHLDARLGDRGPEHLSFDWFVSGMPHFHLQTQKPNWREAEYDLR